MAPTIGVNLRVTGHCNQGGRKYMEDYFVVAYQQTEDEKNLEYAYFGIFDGHGGKEAALYAKEHLMSHIVNQKNFWSDDDESVLKAIREGFITTHLAMWKEVGTWPKTMSGLPSTSGTTSSVAFIRRGKLFIGHVGDSKIVLGYQTLGNDAWAYRSLTMDHKPDSPKEKKRIYSVGGRVISKAGVERVVWNRPRVGHKGPIRRSTHFDQIPFLAVARSLGDLWSYNYLKREFVVSPEPDVSVFPLNPNRDRCIILGSDGLWNMVSPRDAIRFVQKAERENEHMILEGGGSNGVGKPVNNPSKLLVDQALGLWSFYCMRADNTSVVTVFLDPPGPPRSEVLLRRKFLRKLRPREELGDSDGSAQTTSETEDSENRSTKKSDTPCDSSDDSLIKEKKRISNTPESRVANLPKPVVLFPQRVKRPSDPDKNTNVLEAKAQSQDTSCSSETSSESPVSAEASKPDIPDPSNLATSAQADDRDQTSTTTSADQNVAAVQDDCNSNLSSESLVKENVCDSNKRLNSESPKDPARTHLSDVENIVKTGLEDRLSNSASCVAKSKTNAEVDSPKKGSESKLSASLKRRLPDDNEPLIPVKNIKLSGCSYIRDSISSCQASVARNLIHNTRSQQSRKVKV